MSNSSAISATLAVADTVEGARESRGEPNLKARGYTSLRERVQNCRDETSARRTGASLAQLLECLAGLCAVLGARTSMRSNRLIHPALQGKPVAWFAPNYRVLSDVWRDLQTTLSPIISRTNQQEWRLELQGGWCGRNVVPGFTRLGPRAGVTPSPSWTMLAHLQQAPSETGISILAS